jgi:hypothetical protein
VCFTDSLRSCPPHPHAAEFRVGAANLAGFRFQDKTFDAVNSLFCKVDPAQGTALHSGRMARFFGSRSSLVLPSLPRRAENVIPKRRADTVPDVIILIVMTKMILL